MVNANYEFEMFCTREGFNRSLKHFESVSEIVSDIASGINLADLLIEEITEGDLEQSQLGPIVYALLVDKYNYSYATTNIKADYEDFNALQSELLACKAVDLVGTYIHPELGFMVFNPKNLKHLQSLQVIRKNEIVTVFAGAFNKDIDRKIADLAVEAVLSILNGKKKAIPPSLQKGSIIYKPLVAPAPKPAVTKKKSRKTTGNQKKTTQVQPKPVVKQEPTVVSTGRRKMTPMYSVPVTNELFHNGNVEAWKRIIKSYQAKNPRTEVYIFYDNERIHDINALFKWGKVKHGSVIIFAVAGEDIKDVAKLQRYLMQGASPRFEDFLRFPVNTVLNLF